MSTATLTSKGQITLPADLRRALSLASGDRIEFFRQADGVYGLRPLTGSVRGLKGIVSRPAKRVSIAQMDRAIGAAVRLRDLASIAERLLA